MSSSSSLLSPSPWRKSGSIALAALGRNRLQTCLTISGVATGVATLVAMVAVGRGAQDSIERQVRAAGMNVVVVSSGNYKMEQQWTSDGETEEDGPQGANDQPSLSEQESEDPQNAAGLGSSDRMSIADAEAIGRLHGVQYVSPGVVDNARVLAGDDGWFTRFHGEGQAIAKIRRAWILVHGRFFTDNEVRSRANVAVLGSVVSEHLFGDRNPVGATVIAKGQSFRVVGVIGTSSWVVPAVKGDDQFDAIYIPVTTAQRAVGRASLDRVTISTMSTGDVTSVSRELTALLRDRHQLTGAVPNDFTVASEAHRTLSRGGMRTDIARAVVGNVGNLDKVTLDELAKTMEHAGRTMTVLLVSIGTVSLVVGGIGIMNIMLLSVTERTREIGIRRAIGARSDEVSRQFLMESLLLSVLGGVLGVIIGAVAVYAISSSTEWATVLSPVAILIALCTSAAVGVGFGYYPARQAAQVDPMDALRYE